MPVVDSAMTKIAPRFSSQDGKGRLALGQPMEASAKERLLERVRKNMERAITAESDNRKSGLDDRMFKIGQQWPTEIMAQRNLDKRPCLTVNKLPTFVHQIVNDQRQNRPSININPNGDRGDPEVAKMYRGLIRFIERDCAADIAYDTAFDDAVTMGWGYWRVTLEWEAPDSFNCVLVIRQVRNPFSVYLDPAHIDPTGADAKWAFVTQMISRAEFTEKYPGATQMPYSDGGIGDRVNAWTTKDEIRIAEYYEIEYNARTLIKLSNGHVGWEDELDDISKGYLKRGKLQVIDERESQVPTVMWYKVTAVDVLKEEEWIGTSIPIVKVVGNATDIEGKLKLSGIIRDAKDPQRMKNYWSALALDTPLPTPVGWTTMGAVQEGDMLLDETGAPTRVEGVSPIYINHDCYRVEFDDGATVIADATHRWQVEDRGKRYADGYRWQTKIVTTAELSPQFHRVKSTSALNLPQSDLAVDPYLLGVWLGDGSTANAQICAGDEDIEAMKTNLQAAGCRVGITRRYGDKVGVFTVHGVSKQFIALGLFGNKHIPAAYLRASSEQRYALLQGLMDTDGSCHSNVRQCSFTTTNPALQRDFSELLRSLGIKAVCCVRDRGARMFPGGHTYQTSAAWQFQFSMGKDEDAFRLPRKLATQHTKAKPNHRRTKSYRIVSVTPVKSVPVKCVSVDSPSHLYLCSESMIPTHNTAMTEIIALQPKAPWVMEEGQGEGHEDDFKNANVKNIPVLYYKGTSVGGTMAPPPQRQPMAGIPAGIMTAMASAEQDLMGVTGIRFDATLAEKTIDESGKALHALRQMTDMGAFHYVDNLSRSLRRTGEILVEAIPLVYDEQRVVTILREDDKEEQVKIDPSMSRPSGEEKRPDGKTRKLFNPTALLGARVLRVAFPLRRGSRRHFAAAGSNLLHAD